MGFEINEVKQKLEILERIKTNPELIFTELFSKSMKEKDEYKSLDTMISEWNLLYNISIDGMHIHDYIRKYIKELAVFDKCSVRFCQNQLEITTNDFFRPENKDIEMLKTITEQDIFDTTHQYISIVKININNSTYIIDKTNENWLRSLMEKPLQQEVLVLSDWWVRFENLTIKKSFINAINALKTNKRFIARIIDFLFWIRPFNKRIAISKLKEEKEIIKKRNAKNEIRYKRELEMREYYKSYLPLYFEYISNKQTEIENYLKSIGFTKDLYY